MEKNYDPQAEQLLIDVLTRIVNNQHGYVPQSVKRINELEKYMFTYSLWSDDYSRELYARILSRMLAMEFINDRTLASLFPIWSDEFRTNYEHSKATVMLPDLKHPDDQASQIIFPETFYMPAYEYKNICMVKENEIVFDIGAWIGDTAYVFSKKMKGTGKIYAFEPMPQNYEMLAENAKKIPNLTVNNIALGKEPGTLKFSFNENNSGASRYNLNGSTEVIVTTVDIFVKENSIERVDFIKADIEGAECDMLLGAAETIKRFHPKLAICIYHRGQIDHYEVPKVILSIRQDYEFYVEAYSNGLFETVLFAVPVDHIPVRRDLCRNVENIKKLYIAVHDKLITDYRSNFYQEFNHLLDKYLNYHFDYKIKADSEWMILTKSGDVHYKVYFQKDCVGVELDINHFDNYSENHQKRINDIFNLFIKRDPDFKKGKNKFAIYIGKEIPYSSASPDNIARIMSVLIKGTIMPLKECGVIDMECVNSMFMK